MPPVDVVDRSWLEPRSQSERTFRSLVRVLGLLKRVMHPLFQQHGITPAQWAVLRLLSQAQKAQRPPLTVSDLGKLLLVRPPSVTGVIDSLVQRSLVSRCSPAADLRVRQITLTPQGQGLVDGMGAEHEKRVRQLMKSLGSEECAQLRLLLEKLAIGLEPLARECEGSAGVRSASED